MMKHIKKLEEENACIKKMPEIFVSSLFLYPSITVGLENYFYNLLKGFRKKENIKLIINNNIKKYDRIMEQYERININVKTNRCAYDYFLGLFVSNISKKDLIFSPNYITPVYPFNTYKITTIHDVQYLHYPEFFSRKKRLWLHIAHLWTLNNADKVICISNSVKNDIVDFFGKKHEKKLEVIYNPIDFSRFDKRLNDRYIKDKYILSVAAQHPHKNLLTLVKAFNLASNLNCKLVLAGQPGANLRCNYKKYNNALNKEISENRENIIVTGHVSDDILGDLYNNCELFVFPSLFEGFGMPPVEAMGLGKPTITTTRASLKEVTLGKAIYLTNPEDFRELSALMQKVLLTIDTYKEKFEKVKASIRDRYDPEISNEYFDILHGFTL